VKKFLVPGIVLLAICLFAGGLYFRQRGLLLLPKETGGEEEGAVSGLRTGVPENFPQDIPLFEPAEILSSLESKERIQLTLQTGAPVEKVFQFYQQKMEGWDVVEETTGLLVFSKNGRRLEISITPEPGGSTLVILNNNP